MNKKDLTLVVVLILMIPLWWTFDRFVLAPRFPQAPLSAPTEVPADFPSEAPAAAANPVRSAELPASLPEVAPEVAPEVSTDIPGLRNPGDGAPAPEAKTVVLRNEVLEIKLSNLGASVLRADLLEYPATLEDKEQEGGEIVSLDFASAELPGLMYNMMGLNRSAAFEMEQPSANTVHFSRRVTPALEVRRSYTLEEGYELKISEAWVNHGEAELPVPAVDLFLGAMYPQDNISQKFGPFVGIDAKHLSPTGVKHYVKDLRKNADKVDGIYTKKVELPLEWVGVKNKFFTQVLTLAETDGSVMDALTLRAEAGKKGDALISYAQPSVNIGPMSLVPGQTVRRDFSYYVGPISMEGLTALGKGQNDLIDFRLFRFIVPLGKGMMWGLNKLYALTGNWGVAIILLTFVVRMLFWPLTQKGAENMKRMSELSPQMKALKEKHKNNPQKLNAEMSAFYKANKVNPMAGCLPMLVQIPVFISLYGVLRVAVELRFAEFLWVKDLSEQEALFFVAGFPVNILPLTMGVTMIFQQRLTPSNMDPQQKKIMMMMPIVFLFICYNMPAGLLLYWTTSNLISIYQTTHTRRRDAKKAAAAPVPAPGPTSAPASAPAPKGKLKPVKNPKASPSRTKKG